MSANSSFTVCTLFGIPVRLSYTWLPMFLIVLVILGQFLYPEVMKNTATPLLAWVLAAVSTALYFVSLVAHEIGHGVVARRLGIHVRSVELFMFGGVAHMVGYAQRPRDEVLLAGAGPATTFALAALFSLIWLVLRFVFGLNEPVILVFEHAAEFNAILLVFNVIPAYPLDGGRLLQGVLWHITRRRTLSAAVAAGFGLLLALGLVGGGVFGVILGNPIAIVSGILLVFLGVYIARFAISNYRGARIIDRVSRLAVTAAVDPRVQAVPPTISNAALDEVAFPTDDIPLAVILDPAGHASAIVPSDDVRPVAPRSRASSGPPMATPVDVPAARPDPATADDRSLPIDPRFRVSDSTPLLDALSLMGRLGARWLIVESADALYVGTVSEASLHLVFHPDD